MTTFSFDGFEIHNPYWDETGRFPVDPAEYYGQPAIAFLAQHPGHGDRLAESPDNHV